MGKQISRDNHFVAQRYLRRWSEDRAHICAYRTLVSRPDVPLWTSRSIKRTAFYRDLYSIPRSDEVDAIERWLATEFEEPALGAIERATTGQPLIEEDHHRLAGFYAAQQVRTPANYFESRERWELQIPETLETTLRDSIEKLRAAAATQTPVDVPQQPSGFDMADAMRVKVSTIDDRHAAIEVEVATGRAFWMNQIRRVLTGRALETLRQHRWSVVMPHGNAEWITSDCPAMRLWFDSPTSYHFKAGWAHENCDLLLPLSPRHLLYTRVGHRSPERFTFDRDQTRLMLGLLAQRAHRWIFAREPIEVVSELRPRQIDAEQVQAEDSFWRNWGEVNDSLEAELRSGRSRGEN